jgi:hypothetical protein
MTDHVNGASFDAAAFELADDATAEVEIFDPRSKTGTGIFISLLSKDSEKARALTRSQLNRRFKVAGRTRGGLSLTAEELEAESMDLLIACTKDWRGMNWNGEPMKCTADNVRMVYTKSPIIREQVDDAINDRALFTRS